MQTINQDIDHAAKTAFTEDKGVSSRLRGAIFAVMARRQTRRVVQSLSDAQLRDAGIDRAAVFGNRPVIEVDARVAIYLASLR